MANNRSPAVIELQNQLKDMLSSNGGLRETRWVGRLLGLMEETANLDGKEYLLGVLMRTPQNDQATLGRFMQLGGISVLASWLSEIDEESVQIVHSALSCLSKFSLPQEILDSTKINRVLRKLSKNSDPSISAKAASILSKWKKCVSLEIAKPTKKTKPKEPKSKQ